MAAPRRSGVQRRSFGEARQINVVTPMHARPLSLHDTAHPASTPVASTCQTFEPRRMSVVAATENATIIPSSRALREYATKKPSAATNAAAIHAARALLKAAWGDHATSPMLASPKTIG